LSASADDGGQPITGYRVESSTDAVTWTTAVVDTGSTSTSHSVTGLPAGVAVRFRDTRGPDSTVDGLGAGGRVAAVGSVTEVLVAGRGGVPLDAATAVLNVTVVGPAGAGFATVFPCGQGVPTASNVNYRVGVGIANAVNVRLGDGGKVCVFTFAATRLLADVNGYVAA
jgi:hypothetical protein